MKRLLLVGGGHAQLEVLRSLRHTRFNDTEVVLVSSGRFAAYTGMVPGLLAGRYSATEIRFDLEALVRMAGGSFVNAIAEDVDGAGRSAGVNGKRLEFDACSIDIGSAPVGYGVPGVMSNALPLRPLTNVVELLRRFDLAVGQRGAAAECVIVGGGAGGVEVALGLAVRGNGRAGITIVHEGEELIPHAPRRARMLADAACQRAGVAVRKNSRVESVTASAVALSDGVELRSALTVWLTGAAPPPMLAASTLARSSAGYFSVDEALRATDGSAVWGAGDCITIRGNEWVPKAGVYAVREAPILAHNLRVFLTARGRARVYRPQRDFLSILSTSRNRALLLYRGMSVESRWAAALKDSIDRRFMRRYALGEDLTHQENQLR